MEVFYFVLPFLGKTVTCWTPCDMEHSIFCSKITICYVAILHPLLHIFFLIRTHVGLFDNLFYKLKLHGHHHLQQIEKRVVFYSLTLCQGMCFDECQQKIDLLSFWGQQERSGTEQIRYSFINSGLRKPRISAVFSE